MQTAIIILCATVIIQSALLVYIGVKLIEAYRYHDAPKPPYKPILTPSKRKETPEERRERTIMENLENYTGDGKGQVKV